MSLKLLRLKTSPTRQQPALMHQKPYVLAIFLVLSAVAANAQDLPEEDQQKQGESGDLSGETSSVEVPGEKPEAGSQDKSDLSRSEKAQQYVSLKVDKTANWFDSFFDDSHQVAEDASTRVRFRPELFLRQEQGAKVRVKVAAKVNLPNLSRKMSLVIGGDDGTGDFDNSLDDTLEGASIGVQAFGKQTKKWNLSLTAGVTLDDFALFAGPRARYLHPLGDSSQIRFIQIFRWFTNNGWDTRSRLDFDHVFSNGIFFRQTVDGRRRADKYDEEGFRTRVSTLVNQRLSNSSGLQYEWFTIFHTEPDSHVDSTTVALRYRKRYKYDWLFFEVVPQLAFEDEFDWDINPGIRFRVEVIFGKDQRKIKSGEDEGFHW
jgi:hypothetical protein